MEKYLEWTTVTHEHYDKSADWFWVVGGVLGVILALSAYFHNLLLIVIALVGGGLLFYLAVTPADEITCTLTNKGVILHNELFLYKDISSFWVFDHDHRKKMVIQTKRYVIPHILVPLGETDPATIRQILRQHVPEKEYQLTVSDLVTEYLGF